MREKLAPENDKECKVVADPLKALSSIVAIGLSDKEMLVKPGGRLPAGIAVMWFACGNKNQFICKFSADKKSSRQL